MSGQRYGIYSEFKSSEGGWLGDIPAHWSSNKLKFLADTFASNVDKKTKDGELPVQRCNYTDVYYNDVVAPDLPFMQATATQEQIEKFTLRAGDTIITKDSEDPNDIAVPAFVEQDMPGVICGYHLSMIRPMPTMSPGFLNKTFQCAFARSYFATRSNGLTRYGLGGHALGSVVLPVPPLEEQTQIAKFLDYETLRIDALIEKQQQLIALLKEKRQAVISHAVTKGLNPDAPMRDSGVEWLGEVPAHWVVVRLKHTCEIQSGMPKGKPASATTVDMPMLRVANVQDGWLNLDDVHQIPVERSLVARYLLRSGDVLMNEGGDKLGRGTIWRGEVPNCIHQNHVFAIRPQSIEPAWLDAVTRADYAKFHFYQVAKQSTNLASISSSNIKETPLAVPPIDERKAILDHIDLMTKKTSTTIELAGRQNMLLQERRTALISAAVTGKIDVRGWKAPKPEMEEVVA